MKALHGFVLLFILAIGTFGAPATGVSATDYPKKEITLVVGWAAGGGTDLVARQVAAIAEKQLGKPIVIQNNPGGAGAVSFQLLSASKPDGYTLAMTTTPLLLQKYVSTTHVPYKNLTHIAIVNEDPAAVSVPFDSPCKTLQDFVEMVKKNPGKVRIANAGPGSAWHAMALRFEAMVGVPVIHVAYQGGNPAAVAAAGGHVESTFVSPAEVAPLIAGGKVRMLAVASEQRDPNFPDVPTFKEQGLDLVGGVHRCVSAPKNLPPEILAKLVAAIKFATEQPEYKAFMKTSGLGQRFLAGKELDDYLDSLDATYAKLFQKK